MRGEHAIDARRRRRNHRQPVAPAAFPEQALNRIDIVGNLDARRALHDDAAPFRRVAGGLTGCLRLIYERAQLPDALPRHRTHFIAAAYAERVRHEKYRQPGIAEGARLRATQCLECGRADRERRPPALGRLDAVVDTPRRARPSIAGACDHQIAFGAELIDRGAVCRYRRRTLAYLHDALDAVLAPQQCLDLVDQVVEVGLGVVDEADHFALQPVEDPRLARRCALRGRTRIEN